MQLTQVVSAIIWRGDEILMVRQPDDDQILYWFIPGGVVEPGEMLGEALAYLSGSSPQGRLWQYRQQACGVVDLV